MMKCLYCDLKLEEVPNIGYVHSHQCIACDIDYDNDHIQLMKALEDIAEICNNPKDDNLAILSDISSVAERALDSR